MPFMQHFVKLRARVNQSEMSKYHNFSPLQNSPGETTWRLWATSSSTSSAGPCPGKDSGRRQRLRNTRKSARRSCRPPWRSFVKEHQVGNTFLPADDTRGGGGEKIPHSKLNNQRNDLFTEKRLVRKSESHLSHVLDDHLRHVKKNLSLQAFPFFVVQDSSPKYISTEIPIILSGLVKGGGRPRN